MELKIRNDEDNAIIDIIGEVNLYEAGDIKAEMSRLAEDNTTVILNMEKVATIDSAGVGALMSGRGKLLKMGCKLKLCNLTETVLKVLEINNLSTFFDIYNSEEAALSNNDKK